MSTAQVKPLSAHVMIDARYLQPKTSGIGRYTEHLIRQLITLDPSLKLTLITHPSQPRPISHPSLSYQTYDAAPNSLRTRFVMAKRLDFAGVDLFHSPFNLLPANLPVPAVFTLHDIMWLINPSYCTDSLWRKLILGGFYQHVIPRSAHEAKRLMTVSHASKDEIERFFPHQRGKVHVTYNGLDPFFSPVPEDEAWAQLGAYLPPKSRFVLVVGQGSPYKNHDGALAGFLEAFGDDPDVYFVLIRRFSRGPAKRLEHLLTDPRLKGRVVRLQYVSGEELKAFFSVASVFLFPSLYEGFGLPALEAMACGAPVLGSNVGAVAEVCGDAALTVPPRDAAQMGAALKRLVYDEALRATMRAKGAAHAASFTWQRCALEAHRAYSLALGRSVEA